MPGYVSRSPASEMPDHVGCRTTWDAGPRGGVGWLAVFGVFGCEMGAVL